MKKVFLVVLVAIGVLNCSQAERGAFAGAINVSSAEASELIKRYAGDENFVILDIRTPTEFEQMRIEGAINVNIAAPDFKQKLGAIGREKTILLYCRSGNRSRSGLAVMEELGFEKIYHLHRGIIENTSALPTESGAVE